MSNRISVKYSTTKDYTSLNRPAFVKALKIYNLILLPIDNIANHTPNIGDQIGFIDHSDNSQFIQKIVLKTGYITIYENKYYYFYIANGIQLSDHDYSIVINNSIIKLSKKINEIYNAKLLIGSLILDDNYQFMFDKDIPALINIHNQNIKLSILDVINKYNYYSAFKNNTILTILDSDHLEILYAINNSYIYDILVRPLYYKDFRLGSITIKILDYSGVLDNKPLEFKIFLNNRSFFLKGNNIQIDNLPSGPYSINIIDREGLLDIDTLNGQVWNKDIFDIVIESAQDIYNTNIKSFPQPREYTQPLEGFANLMINLDFDHPVEVIGPNSFYILFDTGYQTLLNIPPETYTIKQKNISKSFIVYANQHNIISSLI